MLQACGGNAGTVGISSGTALYSSAPSTVTIPIGKVNYTVGGGTAPYRTSTSNTTIVSSEVKGTTLSINGLTGGSAQVSIIDATGASISINVTVTAPVNNVTLFSTAPEAITLAINKAASFTISGGKPNYMVSSSNTGVAAVGMNGNSFFISGISAGSAQVLLFDSVGTSIAINVTVGSGVPTTNVPLYVTSASTISSAINEVNTYSIGGGMAPYKVSSNNNSVATASITDATLKITGVSKGTAQILVFDATGTSITITLTVDAGNTSIPLFVTAPSSILLTASKQATYKIGGGTAPYTATSNNTKVASTSVSDTNLNITAIANGSAQILVFDATGTSISITTTVESDGNTIPLYSTAASSITIINGSTTNFTIGGGIGPYIASSNNTSVATANITNNTLSIQANVSGTARITVFDTVGSSITIETTVTPINTSTIETQPSNATANVGDTLRFIVSGGSPPYSITSHNTNIATVSTPIVTTNGGSILTTLNNVGTTNIIVVDSLGQTKSISLTANQQSALLRLSPNVLTIAEDNASDFTLNIYGGVGPYRAFTSDQTLTAVSTSGSTLTVGIGSNLNRCINPVDTSGVHVPNGTFDVTITVIDSLGASATSIITIKDNGIGTGSVSTQANPFVPPCL